MNTNCAFYIGTTHDFCQDYARVRKNAVIVSDGCSGSLCSDIGSRVLGVTAINKIIELDSLYNFDEKECILLARPSIQMLNLPHECLDATLLAAIVYEYGSQAICCGDGVIVISMKNDYKIVIDCAYSDSYPFYMNYLYDTSGRYLSWKNNHNKRIITMTAISPEGEVISEIIGENKRLPQDAGVIKVLEHKTLVEIPDNNLIEFIAVMSDGVHSFYETITTETSKFNKSVSYIDVLKDFLAFKNYNQLFVQRRVNKFRKTCAKKNWGNSDDVSLAVIYAGE
jgi:hypothetical protein